ncbi:MAG: folylpolyglutamate synthase/dihydrofolate synthase family protein [Paludibacteraceae bacterium]|nr:folylpolyglutamate synthase/dihydrofolate synthase family protein [Paludibacteraceae bacterium]
MSYEQTLQYLYASQPAFHIVGSSAYKPGLENTRRLMAHLGNPHERFAEVHIAGTNGKGSTSHLIAASLQCAGYRVGLYTSPHLVDYRERIRINGAMIPKEEVVRFVDDHRAFLEEVKPSFFETTMALAFWYFAKEQVDIAVVECGLGGRLDSTNIITPLLSVITNIGFDHTEFLGDTLAKIAYEKAGIIKPGVPCVIGETHPETMPVFLAKAKECGILGEGLETTDCRIWFADQCGYLRRKRQRDIPDCQLHGIYQEKNMQTAYVALCALKDRLTTVRPSDDCPTADAERQKTTHFVRCQTDIVSNAESVFQRSGLAAKRSDSEAVLQRSGRTVKRSCSEAVLQRSGLALAFSQVCTLTGLRGRWETVREHPLTICDTGHNAHGIKYVAEQLQTMMPRFRNTRIIFGMVADKDISEVVRLLPRNAIYYFTQPDNHRAFPAKELLKMFEDEGLRTLLDKGARSKDKRLNSADSETSETNVISPSSCVLHPSSNRSFPTISVALSAAFADASPDDLIFIGGSNYVVGTALQSPLLSSNPQSSEIFPTIPTSLQ